MGSGWGALVIVFNSDLFKVFEKARWLEDHPRASQTRNEGHAANDYTRALTYVPFFLFLLTIIVFSFLY
jgi:hypothetical protein